MCTILRPLILACAMATLLVPLSARADHLELRMPRYSDGLDGYFTELLTTSLAQWDHEARIEYVVDIPHLRSRDMLAQGTLCVLWLPRTREHDREYIPVPVNLTGNLSSQRILLVPQAQKDDYKDVKSLDDFRRLGKVGGFGSKWHDVDVWSANDLPHTEVANWRLLYKMVADGTRGVDYMVRGINEVVLEAKLHPELVIEPHLKFVYDSCFIFYVTPRHPQLAEELAKALTWARDSGLMQKLIDKHWGRNSAIVKPAGRTVIRMKYPE